MNPQLTALLGYQCFEQLCSEHFIAKEKVDISPNSVNPDEVAEDESSYGSIVCHYLTVQIKTENAFLSQLV